MIINELYFLLHSLIIGTAALISLRLGQQALIAFVVLCSILANLFVLKQIILFGFDATCSDAYTVGAVFGLNLLQEYFGRPITQTTIWISSFLLIFYTIVCQLHLLYIPSVYDTMQEHYLPILQFMPRIAIASFIVSFLVQQCDSFLYGILKNYFNGRFLTIRNYISIGVCQLFDTILFSFLGLYGLVHNIWHIIFVSYCVKLMAMLLTTPFVMMSKKISR